MTRRPLEAVVFDAGGTLVRLDFEWMSAAVTALGHPLEEAALRRGEVEGRRRFDAARRSPVASSRPGEAIAADTRAYFGGMLEACGVPAPVIEEALHRFIERQHGPGLWTRPAEHARATLDALCTGGLRLACVSNSDGRAEAHLRACDVHDGLAFVVDSHLEGVEKPDPRIFHLALERLGVAAERALHVGDIRSIEADGARAAGMHAVLLDPFGDYAPPGIDAVPDIGALPEWIASRFTLPSAGAAPAHAIEPSRETAGGTS